MLSRYLFAYTSESSNSPSSPSPSPASFPLLTSCPVTSEQKPSQRGAEPGRHPYPRAAGSQDLRSAGTSPRPRQAGREGKAGGRSPHGAACPGRGSATAARSSPARCTACSSGAPGCCTWRPPLRETGRCGAGPRPSPHRPATAVPHRHPPHTPLRRASPRGEG